MPDRDRPTRRASYRFAAVLGWQLQVVGWGDGPQQDALDAGRQHVLRSVLSQQASEGIGPGLGVEDVAMTISFVNEIRADITRA